MPPLDSLEPEPVATDPSVRIYTRAERFGDGVLRLVWQASAPGYLLAEYREPGIVPRISPEKLAAFWTQVKERVGSLGPLRVVAADPYR